MLRKYFNLIAIIILSLSCCFISCSHSHEQETLQQAEAIMEQHPDSAMILLSTLDKDQLSGDRQKAKYALLMSIALDKNYIDTTSFDVLQPAIDYYLKKGFPDEQLRTYYYQGVIFQNKGDLDNALNSYVKGLALSHNCTDSLTIARTLVAQGLLYNALFDFDAYVSCNLTAATIYKTLNRQSQELDCLLNALSGAIILGNETLGDSIIKCANKFTDISDFHQRSLIRHQLSYALKFNTNENIDSLIHRQEANLGSLDDVLSLALAYDKTDNNSKAQQMLDYVRNSNQPYDTIRYLSIAVQVFEHASNYQESLFQYKRFIHKQDSIALLRYEQKAQSLEDKHQIELKAQKELRHKNNILWGCFVGIAVLLMSVIILILLVRSNKAKREIAQEKMKTKDAENAKLKSDKENLALENKNLQLERDNKTLEAENLAHRVETLENESDILKSLINDKNKLPQEVQNAIKVRIEMLNSLFASHITSNHQYEKPYDIWVKELIEKTDEFMNSNRLAFQASHPRFIKYFEDHDLSIEELNYVCLYAIGLRGKEVGNYMKKRSHVNMSSAIRKKLGIDKHETNIGIYVRKLLKSL